MVFLVIETESETGELEVSVVPTSWTDGTVCLWPPGPGVSAKAKSIAKPGKNWQKYKYQVLKSGIGELSSIAYLHNVALPLQ